MKEWNTELKYYFEKKSEYQLWGTSLIITLFDPVGPVSYMFSRAEHAGTWHHVKCAQVKQACCGRRRKGGWCLHMPGWQTCVTCLLCLLRAEPLSRAVPTHATHSSSFLVSLCNQPASRPPSFPALYNSGPGLISLDPSPCKTPADHHSSILESLHTWLLCEPHHFLALYPPNYYTLPDDLTAAFFCISWCSLGAQTQLTWNSF